MIFILLSLNVSGQIFEFDDGKLDFYGFYSAKPMYNNEGLVTITEVKRQKLIEITKISNCGEVKWNKTINAEDAYYGGGKLFVDSNNCIYILFFAIDEMVYSEDSIYFLLLKIDKYGEMKYSKRLKVPQDYFFNSGSTQIGVNNKNGELIFTSTVQHQTGLSNVLMVSNLDSNGYEKKQVFFNTLSHIFMIKKVLFEKNGNILIVSHEPNETNNKQSKLITLNKNLAFISTNESGFENLRKTSLYEPFIYHYTNGNLSFYTNGKSEFDYGSRVNMVCFGNNFMPRWHIQLIDSNVRNTNAHLTIKQDSLFYVPIGCLNKTLDSVVLKMAVINENGKLLKYYRVISTSSSIKYFRIINFFHSAKDQICIYWFDGEMYRLNKFDLSNSGCDKFIEDNGAYIVNILDENFYQSEGLKFKQNLELKARITTKNIAVANTERKIKELCGLTNKNNIPVISDTLICTKGSFIWTANSSIEYSYLWWNGGTDNSSIVEKSGIYWIDKEFKGCLMRDSAKVLFSKDIGDSLEPIYYKCQADSWLLNLPKIKNSSFSWFYKKRGEDSIPIFDFLQLEVPDTFNLFYNSETCSDSFNIVLVNYSSPLDSVVPSKVFCSERLGVINAFSQSQVTWFWSIDSVDSNISVSEYFLEIQTDSIFQFKIQSENNCFFEHNVSLNYSDSFEAKIISKDTVCEGDLVMLRAYIEGDMDDMYTYFWNGQELEKDVKFTFLKSRVINLKVLNSCGTDVLDSHFVAVLKKPISDILILDSLFLYEKYSFKIRNSKNSFSQVIFDSNAIFIDMGDSLIEFHQLGKNTIIINAVSDFGCKDSAYFSFFINDRNLVFIPNAFSPNSDGLNDDWEIIGNYLSFELTIFAETGQKVAHLKNTFWNGTFSNNEMAPLGSYLFLFNYIDAKGSKRQKIGKVNIIE